MEHDEFKEASEYWINKDKGNVKMDRTRLIQEAEAYINANNTCALATGSGCFVRCTPIEYSYFDGRFWMFSEGGLKFVGLEKNSNVCLAIYDKYTGFGKLRGMQVTGIATIIEPFSNEYVKATEHKKIPVEALKKLDHTMNLICIEPTDIDFLNSEFKEQGYSARQHVEFKCM